MLLFWEDGEVRSISFKAGVVKEMLELKPQIIAQRT